MRAEREAFKQIDQLIKEKEDFEKRYFERGSDLVKTVLKEFMKEHPEVNVLRWRQYDTFGTVFFISEFDVGTADGLHNWEMIKDLQLSKCLQALESKFKSIPEILQTMFGSEYIRITQTTNIDSLPFSLEPVDQVT